MLRGLDRALPYTGLFFTVTPPDQSKPFPEPLILLIKIIKSYLEVEFMPIRRQTIQQLVVLGLLGAALASTLDRGCSREPDPLNAGLAAQAREIYLLQPHREADYLAQRNQETSENDGLVKVVGRVDNLRLPCNDTPFNEDNCADMTVDGESGYEAWTVRFPECGKYPLIGEYMTFIGKPTSIDRQISLDECNWEYVE